MGNVFTGYLIIAVVIFIGYLAARFKVGGPDTQRTMQHLAFNVASPALLFTVLAHADLKQMFSSFLAVAFISAAAVFTLYFIANAIWFRRPLAEASLGALSSGYVNANNIGLPVAIYVLGDAQYVAPVLFLQLIVFSPVCLAILDAHATGKVRLGTAILRPFRNPIILGSLAGVIVAVTEVQLPDSVYAPFDIIGGAAVPLMLLAFGMSLRGQRPFQAGSGRKQVAVSTFLKLAVMPTVAFVLAHFVLGLDAAPTFAATVLACLPTAQNVFTYAVKYRLREETTRDTVLLSTIGAFPILMIIAWFLA